MGCAETCRSTSPLLRLVIKATPVCTSLPVLAAACSAPLSHGDEKPRKQCLFPDSHCSPYFSLQFLPSCCPMGASLVRAIPPSTPRFREPRAAPDAGSMLIASKRLRFRSLLFLLYWFSLLVLVQFPTCAFPLQSVGIRYKVLGAVSTVPSSHHACG